MTQFDGVVLLAMFGGLLLLGFAHSFEYARCRTSKSARPPILHHWICGLMLVMGLYAGVHVSPYLPLLVWPTAALLYMWQGYILKKLLL